MSSLSGNVYPANDPKFATKSTHVGQEPEQWTSNAVIPPISLATTFKQQAPAEFKEFEYGRSGNPTRNVLEKCLASLDSAKHAMCFSSGLGATTSITHLLSAGDHIICHNDLYGGTNRYFRKVAARQNLEASFVDATDPENVRKAIKPNTKMVWTETPSNPTLKVTDIKAVSEIVHAASKDIFVVVDSTFVTPYFQRPLELGADIVVHSISKYINGHSDVIMGSVALNCDDLAERLRFLQNAIGTVPSPFDCYLVNRSLKTLRLRMDEHHKNAVIVGQFLEKNKYVKQLLHPGLPSHPQAELIQRQQFGHSGIFSFYHTGGLEESRKLLSALKLITLAESLGGYESLAELPYLMTHASIEEKERVSIGVTDNLIRVSIGLESPEDLVEDLDQALKAAFE